MRMQLQKIVRGLILLCVVLVIASLFYGAFQENWAGLQPFRLALDPVFLGLAFAALCASYVLIAYSWMLLVNALSRGETLSFRASMAIFSASNLAKYIPGRLWSFGFQMYWVGKMELSPSLIPYVNGIIIFISIIISIGISVFYLAFFPRILPLIPSVFCLSFVVLCDILFLFFNQKIVQRIISFVNRTFNSDLHYRSVSMKLMISLHAILCLSTLVFGLSAYLLCHGIGIAVGADHAGSIMAAMIVSDAIGFLAIIVPGGLGVREGLMYLLLKGIASPALAFILPIATRIVSMVVDAALGSTGLLLMRKLKPPLDIVGFGEKTN
jgi:glycosyltransferase 2 family protein